MGETEYLRPFAARIHAQRVKGVEAAIEIGRALREAKGRCRRGDWLIFLDVVGYESSHGTARDAGREDRDRCTRSVSLDTNTLRGLLATASQTLTGSESGKPQVIDVTPEPAATETEPQPEPAATEPGLRHVVALPALRRAVRLDWPSPCGRLGRIGGAGRGGGSGSGVASELFKGGRARAPGGSCHGPARRARFARVERIGHGR